MGTVYHVVLTKEEVEQLTSYRTGKHAARKVLISTALLRMDEGEFTEWHWTMRKTAETLDISIRALQNWKKKFLENGLKAVLERKKRLTPPREIKIDGEVEAHILALACNTPPDGYARWTLRLLAKKAVELDIIDSISKSSVGNILKKNELKPHKSEYWKIPSEQNGDFVARMEDILDVYQRPYNEKRPVVCMDESNKQMLEDVTPPLEAKPGSVRKVDHEYIRKGVADIFMAVEPLVGRRTVKIKENRTKLDWATFIKHIVDDVYPNADIIVLVMDNLNTHVLGSLYKAFTPREARRIASKLEIHYTPVHGSWLNMAEIELSVLSRQCLDRRIADIEEFCREVNAWMEDRNNSQGKIDWQFTTSDARIKLKRLYPIMEENF